jgi:parallel beta-helix repeat protein
VQVAPPTGIHTTDRANLLAAFAQVQFGGTVQFAQGMYVIGSQVPDDYDFLPLTVQGVTLLGHPAGTTLRGCDPNNMDWGACLGIALLGGQQSVRNLTFSDMEAPLALGDPWVPGTPAPGGHLVDGNTFRNSQVGIYSAGRWQQPVTIRENSLINLQWGFVFRDGPNHFLDNQVSVPQPELIPFDGVPFIGLWMQSNTFEPGPCNHNVIAGNSIEGGYVWGIYLSVWGSGTACNHNEIRDNIIRNDRVGLSRAIGIALSNAGGVTGSVEHNRVEGNQIFGMAGAGIVIDGARRNRFVGNTIGEVARGEPFPGPEVITVGMAVLGDENEILDNLFADPGSFQHDLGHFSAILWGNQNQVRTIAASDMILDLGSGNTITGPGSVFSAPGGKGAPAVAERAELLRRLGEQRDASHPRLRWLAPR